MTRPELAAPRRRAVAISAVALAAVVVLALVLAAIWPQYLWAAALWTGIGVLAVGAGGAAAMLVRRGFARVAGRALMTVSTLASAVVAWAVARACLVTVSAVQPDAAAVVLAAISAVTSYAYLRMRASDART